MRIWDKYEKDYRAAYVTPLTKGEFIGDRLETFVGTLAQIKAEEARLTEEFKKYQRACYKECNEKLGVIFNAYTMELREENKHAPPQIFDMAWLVAFKLGCSRGYGDVEDLLDEILEVAMNAYNFGRYQK